MSGLSEAEVVTLADWESDTFGDTLDEAPFDALVTVVERILAARVASAAAENAALRARLDEVRALADDLSALTEGPGRAGTALWPDAARDAYSLAIEEAQGVLRAVLAAAHDEGSEQQGSMAPQANEAAPESDSGADVGGNATGVIRGAQRGDSA